MKTAVVDLKDVQVFPTKPIEDLLIELSWVKSKAEAQRKLKEGAVTLDNWPVQIKEIVYLSPVFPTLLRCGRRYINLKCEFPKEANEIL